MPDEELGWEDVLPVATQPVNVQVAENDPRAYHRLMFEMFKRKSGRAHVDSGQVFEGVNAALMQTGRGSVPSDIAAGRFREPTPDYIAETTTPSEDLWAREQASYRAKNETQ